MATQDNRITHLLLGIMVLVWGPNMGIVKSAYQDLHPIFFAAVRFSISAVLMLATVYWKERDLRIDRQDWGRVALVGALGLGLYQFLWSLGLDRTTASNSALILSTQPLLGILYADLAKQESVGRRQYGGMLLALGGVILVILKPTARLSFSLETLPGDLLTVIASCCFAVFFSSWSKPLLKVYSPLRLMAYSMAVTSLVLWITVPFFGPLKPLDQVGAQSWYSLGYAIVFSGIVGHVLWYEGISRIGVARTMVYSFLVPIWAVLFNHFFLGEKLYVQQIIGGALILWGVRTALRN